MERAREGRAVAERPFGASARRGRRGRSRRAPGSGWSRPGVGQLDGAAGDVVLGDLGAAGDLLDGPAVAVAGGEVLAGVDPGRVVLEDHLDAALLLEEDVPVDHREQAEADHAVADRDLVGGLAAVLVAEDPVGVLALARPARLRAASRSASHVGPRSRRSWTRRTTMGSVKGGNGASADRGRGRCPARSSSDVGLRRRGTGRDPGFGGLRAASHPRTIRSARRRRFSIRTRRSIVGTAQSSPIRQRRGRLERVQEPGDPRLVELAVGVGHQGQGQGVDPGDSPGRARRPAWAARV